jgi:hypothetical protein
MNDFISVHVDIDELRDALEKSVSLQSHYADLLNMHDGGKRIVFKNADEWLERIRKLSNDKP